MRVTHTFGPVYNKDSRILILGSMPSVKSRKKGFYYMHPRNRFWPLLETLLKDPVPDSIPGKIAFLQKHHIALWDVVNCCDIKGSSDVSIKNAVPNDIASVLQKTQIHKVFTNGKTADRLYRTLVIGDILPAVCLPSTSPANAQYQMPRLSDEWEIILNY